MLSSSFLLDFVATESLLGGGAQLSAMLLFAKANTFWRNEDVKRFPFALLAFRSTVSIALLGVIALALNLTYLPFDLSTTHSATFGLGTLGGLALFLFAKSLAELPAKLVFFGGTVHLFSGTAVGYWVLHEDLSMTRIIVLILLAIAQIILVYRDLEQWKVLSLKMKLRPFIVGTLWGIHYPLLGIVQNQQTVWETLVWSEWGVLTFLTTAFLVHSKSQFKGLLVPKNIRNMSAQATLSITAQSLSIFCIQVGGVIFQSILSSFANVINVIAFKIQFKEHLEFRYLLYFIGYGILLWLL
jgi:hypothetical protein